MFKRLDAKGFSHHLLLFIIPILVVGGVGAYVLNASRASGGFVCTIGPEFKDVVGTTDGGVVNDSAQWYSVVLQNRTGTATSSLNDIAFVGKGASGSTFTWNAQTYNGKYIAWLKGFSGVKILNGDTVQGQVRKPVTPSGVGQANWAVIIKGVKYPCNATNSIARTYSELTANAQKTVAEGFNVVDPLVDYPVGLKHIRIWDNRVTWSDVNPQKNVWDWSRLDSIVDTSKQKGATDMLYVLGMSPGWAVTPSEATLAEGNCRNGLPCGAASVPLDLATWDEYVTKVVTRYKGKIAYYQVWNEPQVVPYWRHYDKVSILGDMTKRAKVIIDRIDPGAQVVSAPVISKSGDGGAAYLAALKANAWPVDIFAFHNYVSVPKNSDDSPSVWLRQTNETKALLGASGAPTKPLWVTETNYQNQAEAGFYLNKNNIPQYIQQTDNYARQAGVERLYWYAYGKQNPVWIFGIDYTKGSVGTTALSTYWQ